MSDLFVGLGSNLGDRAQQLRSAARELGAASGLRLRALSRIRETAPVGGPPQPDYLNAVARYETSLTPQELLRIVQRLERRNGRVRTVVNGPRTLDLDLLWHSGAELTEPALTLPHPRLRERRFVLEPLAELAPGLPLAGGRSALACLRALRGEMPA